MKNGMIIVLTNESIDSFNTRDYIREFTGKGKEDVKFIYIAPQSLSYIEQNLIPLLIHNPDAIIVLFDNNPTLMELNISLWGFKNKIYAITYSDYVDSPIWEERKDKYFKNHERKCYMCGEAHYIQLHHLDYNYLGYERDMDLIPLCHKCHKKLHDFLENAKNMYEECLAGSKELKRQLDLEKYEKIKNWQKEFWENRKTELLNKMDLLPPIIPGHKPKIAGTLLRPEKYRETVPHDLFIKLLKSKK